MICWDEFNIGTSLDDVKPTKEALSDGITPWRIPRVLPAPLARKFVSNILKGLIIRPARRSRFPNRLASLRHLGIPNVIERLIQQSHLYKSGPRSSIRLSVNRASDSDQNRSGHGATSRFSHTIRSGYRCVRGHGPFEISSIEFQHESLMARVMSRF